MLRMEWGAGGLGAHKMSVRAVGERPRDTGDFMIVRGQACNSIRNEQQKQNTNQLQTRKTTVSASLGVI